MDREILFRAKRLDNGEWAEGYYCKLGEKINPKIGYILCKAASILFEEDGTMQIGGFVEVDPSTVGQYTGLTDKHGVKIFKGDIVRYISGEFDVHAAVKVGEYEQDGSGGEYGPTKCVGVYLETIDFTRPDWAEELGANPPDYETTVSPLDRAVDGAEVIGNIHDNPELMPEPPKEAADESF